MCYYSMTVKVTHNEHRETETTALYFTMSTSCKDRGVAELFGDTPACSVADSARFNKIYKTLCAIPRI
jgi:hypothetical protein